MRTDNIDVTFKIPLYANKPDLNGNIYTNESMKEAYKSIINKPIIAFGEDGNEIPMGVITDAEYEDDCIKARGVCFFGGTNCNVEKMNEENGVTVIDKFTITSFGISK